MNDTRKDEIKIVVNSIIERCATANIKITAIGGVYVKDKITGKIYLIEDFEEKE